MNISYIILDRTGERLDLAETTELGHDYYWMEGFCFCFNPDSPNDSYIFKLDGGIRFDDPYNEAISATTMPYKAYDPDGNLLIEVPDGDGTIWL